MTVALANAAPPHYVAFPGLGSLAADAFDGAMKSVWDFAAKLLSTAFGWIDKFTTPDLNPATGPFGGVLPTVTWVAGCVVALLVFVQIGWGAITRGVGLAKLLIGAGQYLLVTASGYAVLAAAATATSGLTAGILKQGLGVDNWAGISGSNNSIFATADQGYTGVQLGMVAIVCVIPAAVGYLIESLVRSAALLILAATMPILVAGLLSEKTSTWFWKGLRWTTALLMLQPATALVVSIGFRVASGASGGTAGSGDTTQGFGQLIVGGLMLLVSLVCPLALFKLLAFVDPSTPSGGAVHGALASPGGHTTGGAHGNGVGAGAGKPGAGQAAGEGATTGRFAAALGKAGPQAAALYAGFQAAHAVAQQGLGYAGNVLGAAGAGHHGMAGSTIPVGGSRAAGKIGDPTSTTQADTAGSAGTNTGRRNAEIAQPSTPGVPSTTSTPTATQGVDEPAVPVSDRTPRAPSPDADQSVTGPSLAPQPSAADAPPRSPTSRFRGAEYTDAVAPGDAGFPRESTRWDLPPQPTASTEPATTNRPTGAREETS